MYEIALFVCDACCLLFDFYRKFLQQKKKLFNSLIFNEVNFKILLKKFYTRESFQLN